MTSTEDEEFEIEVESNPKVIEVPKKKEAPIKEPTPA